MCDVLHCNWHSIPGDNTVILYHVSSPMSRELDGNPKSPRCLYISLLRTSLHSMRSDLYVVINAVAYHASSFVNNHPRPILYPVRAFWVSCCPHYSHTALLVATRCVYRLSSLYAGWARIHKPGRLGSQLRRHDSR